MAGSTAPRKGKGVKRTFSSGKKNPPKPKRNVKGGYNEKSVGVLKKSERYGNFPSLANELLSRAKKYSTTKPPSRVRRGDAPRKPSYGKKK